MKPNSAKLAIDFGNSNTVMAMWNPERKAAETISIPDFGVDDGPVIPSLIHYETAERFFIGDSVHRMNRADLPGTFRWMKRYINLRSPYTLRIGETKINAEKAAADFLRTLMLMAFDRTPVDPADVTITVPLDSFEYYSGWLIRQFSAEDARHIRLIDEVTAAAAGYRAVCPPGKAFFLFDFGGSTMQAAVAAVSDQPDVHGSFFRIVGKAAYPIGGMTLDRWIFSDFLDRHSIDPNGPFAKFSGRQILSVCETFKQRLSTEIVCQMAAYDDFPAVSLSREALEAIFTAHGLYSQISDLIADTLSDAAQHGFSEKDVVRVIPVGGGSQIPSILQTLQETFGAERCLPGDPVSAAALGAAAIAGGASVVDYLRHTYAIRSQKRNGDGYEFIPFIKSGTTFPTAAPAASLVIKAAFDHQTLMGLAIYEITDAPKKGSSESELVFSDEGAVMILPLTEDERQAEHLFWLNHGSPSFLHANPPGMRGEPCFRLSFDVDPNRMLLVTASDLRSGELVMDHFPVVRLI